MNETRGAMSAIAKQRISTMRETSSRQAHGARARSEVGLALTCHASSTRIPNHKPQASLGGGIVSPLPTVDGG